MVILLYLGLARLVRRVDPACGLVQAEGLEFLAWQAVGVGSSIVVELKRMRRYGVYVFQQMVRLLLLLLVNRYIILSLHSFQLYLLVLHHFIQLYHCAVRLAVSLVVQIGLNWNASWNGCDALFAS